MSNRTKRASAKFVGFGIALFMLNFETIAVAKIVVFNTPGAVSFTITSDGFYRLAVSGAEGGAATAFPSSHPGFGAAVESDFYFTSGEILDVAVGGEGGDASFGGGGGGGSFVTVSGAPLIVAGGGGGAGIDPYYQATDGTTFPPGSGEGGIGGFGPTDGGGTGAGGGGFHGNGDNGSGDGGRGGGAFPGLSGGAGGTRQYFPGGVGGYGGGGGGADSGGGGGGFSGGNGGDYVRGGYWGVVLFFRTLSGRNRPHGRRRLSSYN